MNKAQKWEKIAQTRYVIWQECVVNLVAACTASAAWKAKSKKLREENHKLSGRYARMVEDRNREFDRAEAAEKRVQELVESNMVLTLRTQELEDSLNEALNK